MSLNSYKGPISVLNSDLSPEAIKTIQNLFKRRFRFGMGISLVLGVIGCWFQFIPIDRVILGYTLNFWISGSIFLLATPYCLWGCSGLTMSCGKHPNWGVLGLLFFPFGLSILFLWANGGINTWTPSKNFLKIPFIPIYIGEEGDWVGSNYCSTR